LHTTAFVPEKPTEGALDASSEAELAALRSELFEAELASLRSRAADLRAQLATERLTSSHKDLLKNALRGLQRRRTVAVTAPTDNSNALAYAEGFAEVFTALGWDVEQSRTDDRPRVSGDGCASDFRNGDRVATGEGGRPDRVYLRYAEGSASRFAGGSHLRSGSLRLSVVSRPGDTTAAMLDSALRRLGIPVVRVENPDCAENHLQLLIGKQPATRESSPAAG
jgi:hypothetical protein